MSSYSSDTGYPCMVWEVSGVESDVYRPGLIVTVTSEPSSPI